MKWAEAAHDEALTRNISSTQQLGLGGVRLARYLNDAFGSAQCPYAKQNDGSIPQFSRLPLGAYDRMML